LVQEEKLVVKSPAEYGSGRITERVTHVNKDLPEAIAEAKGVSYKVLLMASLLCTL
jgi:hypothetical protein